MAQEHGWTVSAELRHWHPATEDWEDPDKPLPDGDIAQMAEYEALMAAERRETTEERGYPEFEVRVDVPSRHDAIHFAERLRGEGLLAVHRWRFLLVGATDEDSAKTLAERIRKRGSERQPSQRGGNLKDGLAERPWNPFAVLGGLAGLAPPLWALVGPKTPARQLC